MRVSKSLITLGSPCPRCQCPRSVAVLGQVEVDLDEVITATATESAAPAVVLSPAEALSQVPDPRKARGVRHGVLAVLLLGVCAVLSGARSFTA